MMEIEEKEKGNQDAVVQKVKNDKSTFEKQDCLAINSSHQDAVIQKLPETNTNDVGNMANDQDAVTLTSAKAARKVGLWGSVTFIRVLKMKHLSMTYTYLDLLNYLLLIHFA